MADEIFEILRGRVSTVSDSQAISIFGRLMPLLRVAPDDEDTVAAAAHVLNLMDPSSGTSAVLAWWLLTMTGHPSTGGAYHLPDWLPGDVADAMESLRDSGPFEGPVGRVAIAERTLATEVTVFADRFAPDNWQPTPAIHNERSVRANILDFIDESMSAVRAGRRAEKVELNDKALEQLMVANAIDKNSPVWNQTLRRERQFVRWVANVIEMNQVAEPWTRRDSFPVVDRIGGDLSDRFGPIVDLLFEPIVASEGPWHDWDSMWFDSAPQWVIDDITALAQTASLDDRHLLATLTDRWRERTQTKIGSLSEIERKVQKLSRQVEAARERGLRVDRVVAAIESCRFAEAKALFDAIKKDAEVERRFHQLSNEFKQLCEVQAAIPASDDETTELQADITKSLASGDLSQAARMLQQFQQRLSNLTSADDRLRLERARIRLEALGASTSLLDEIDDLLAEDGTDGSFSGAAARIDLEVEAYVQSMRREIDDDVELIEQRRRELEESGDFGAVVEIDDKLEIIGGLVDAEELGSAQALAHELLGFVESRRVTMWYSSDGEYALLSHAIKYCNQLHHFEERDIRRFFVALKTKPFAVLAGLTGSGKSTLARVFAGALGATEENGRYRRISVRPDWIDQSEVLGYVNPRTQRFEPGWLAEAIRDCDAAPDQLHFVVLDEMNLAPVEYYLAEYLSVLEESRGGARRAPLRLYSKATSVENDDEWPDELPFPKNLIVVGTVNVDETTRVLSPRVLDRANVLQLSMNVDSSHHDERAHTVAPREVRFHDWRSVCVDQPDDRHHEFLIEIAKGLESIGIGVGQRSHLEIERYVANAEGVLTDEDALDSAILQRIIPKIRGFRYELIDGLTKLEQQLESTGCERSAAVIRSWTRPGLSQDRFIDGTDPRIALKAW